MYNKSAVWTCLEIKRPKLIFTPCYPSLGVIGGGAKFTKVRLYVFLTVIINDLHQNEKSYAKYLMLSWYIPPTKVYIIRDPGGQHSRISRKNNIGSKTNVDCQVPMIKGILKSKISCHVMSSSSSFWWNGPKTVEGSQSMRRRHCCPNDPRVPVSNFTLVLK